MSNTAIIIIIVLVLGAIVGNIMLLRKSTGFPIDKTKDKKDRQDNNASFDDEDDW